MRITEAYLRQVIRKELNEMFDGERQKETGPSEDQFADKMMKGAMVGVGAAMIPMWLQQFFTEHPEMIEAVKNFIEQGPMKE